MDNKPKFLSAVQIILLALIVAGLILLVYRGVWVPRLVGYILEKEQAGRVDSAPNDTEKPPYSQTKIFVTGFGKQVVAPSVKITPTKIVEDSRCPVKANCIQAGTVRVQILLESPFGRAEPVLELGKLEYTGAEQITLVKVEPAKKLIPADAPNPTKDSDYVFSFEVKW